MHEKLSIQDFLVIKSAVLEIKELNIIVGPQAHGKSIIAKLEFFFKAISKDFLESIRSNTTKKELDRSILDRFELYFPRYAWEGKSFKISYTIDNIDISLSGEVNSRGKTNVKVRYSDNLYKIYSAKKRGYKKKTDSEDDSFTAKNEYDNFMNDRIIFHEYVFLELIKGEFSHFFANSIFIPASRSFFANLQKNIFTFMASNLEIDPFLKEFGSLYESSKKIQRSSFHRRNSKYAPSLEKIDRAVGSIVGGTYDYDKDQDWIVSKRGKINLANASSGQQEALPMLLSLLVWPFRNSSGEGSMLFIEEPEAHLFPTSQAHMVSVFSILRKCPGSNFFITTHSPYILTAINNLMLAHDVIESGKISRKDFDKMCEIGDPEPIDYDSVSAYTIVDGVLKSIKNDEYRIIGGEILDHVSDSFESITNTLLEARYMA